MSHRGFFLRGVLYSAGACRPTNFRRRIHLELESFGVIWGEMTWGHLCCDLQIEIVVDATIS
jgi:hypothetical protein